MSCGKSPQKKPVKLLVGFGNAEPGRIVKAEFCHDYGVCVKEKQLGCSDEGFYMNP